MGNRTRQTSLLHFPGNWMKLAFSSLIFLACFLPGPGFSHDFVDNENYGPGFLHIRSQAPAYSFRMTMPHLLPGAIPPGAAYVFGSTLSNVWVNDDDIVMDYEMMDSSLALTYGVDNRLGFALIYDQREYFGGVLDGLIQGIHDLFGIGQSGRTDVPLGRTYFERIGFTTEDLAALDNKAVSLLVQYVFIFGEGGRPTVGVSGGVRYGLEAPTGGDVQHPVDYNISLGVAKRLAQNWYSCLHVGATRFEQEQVLGLEFETDVLSWMLALAWELNDRYTLLMQWFNNQGVIKDFGQFGNPSNELDLGVKIHTKGGGMWEFAIIENVINYDNGPDLGLHLAYVHGL